MPNLAQSVDGMGVTGLWLGLAGGFIHQILAYQSVLAMSDWQQICMKARIKFRERSLLGSDGSHLNTNCSDSTQASCEIRRPVSRNSIKTGGFIRKSELK